MLQLPDIDTIGEAVGIDPSEWKGKCHQISLAVIRAGLVPDGARVARGWALGIRSQHSWVILSDDPYDPKTEIVDPTYHAWTDGRGRVWQGHMSDAHHFPHGYGDIWEYGRPVPGNGDPVSVPTDGLSGDARLFLDILGPLDRTGWGRLANGPMLGWPSKEIVEAMCKVDELAILLPIDIVGMLTDRKSVV